MSTEPINLELVKIALDKVTGSAFEDFVNGFYPTIAGEGFVPLGGQHDGGADAFQETSIWTGKESGIFYQASVEVDYRSKIRRTVKRLREFGRTVTFLVYITSQPIKQIDREEQTLSRELDCSVRVRDRSYLSSHINDSIGTRAAFHTYLAPMVLFLRQVGGSTLLSHSKNVSSPAIYVFLRQELDRREGKDDLFHALADGLILWALEGTDPDKGILMSSEDVANRIAKELPAASKILGKLIPTRLSALATQEKSSRPVRWHRAEQAFCLSYEIRARLEEDNAADESLRVSVTELIGGRVVQFLGADTSPDLVALATQTAMIAVQRTFETEGLELAAFLQGELDAPQLQTVADHIDAYLTEQKITGNQFVILKETVLAALQKAFYDSTEEERLYFRRLSATYTLLFCLNTEPRVVEYFRDMAADFRLFVGSDILVRALSERYLRSENQVTRNTLRLIREAGGKIILTEPVLEEIIAHLCATDYEFTNHYQPVETSIQPIIGRNSDRIMIRAYFYARFDPPSGMTGPGSWPQFVEQICDYRQLHLAAGKEQIKRYLLAQFKMEFEDRQGLATLCEPENVKSLANLLKLEKKDERLAENDALMVLAVYASRRKEKEHSSVSEFGYRTWWLTSESRVLKYTRELVKKNGARYMMRPEFLLNFITLAPSLAEIRSVYRSTFPSILGLQLARRINPEELQKILKQVKEAQTLEPGRREAKISELSDRLKGDFFRRYQFNLREDKN